MGCAISSFIACMWCANGCNASRVADQFAFFPPEPPTYNIDQSEDGVEHIRLMLPGGDSPLVKVSVKTIRTQQDTTIPVFAFKVKAPSCHVLFSHGNAMDCGVMYQFWVEFALRLNVNLYAYDYSGYGRATGKPTEANTYGDIMAVFEYMISEGISPGDIVAYGQSVGSGPSCYLASEENCKGLVLHSPLTTGIGVITSQEGICAPTYCYRSCDMFPNIRRLPSVRCPVFIMHGTEDQVIDVSHGQKLYNKLPRQYRYPPYFVEGADHDDVFERDPAEYFTRLKEFLVATQRQTSLSYGTI